MNSPLSFANFLKVAKKFDEKDEKIVKNPQRVITSVTKISQNSKSLAQVSNAFLIWKCKNICNFQKKFLIKKSAEPLLGKLSVTFSTKEKNRKEFILIVFTETL
ncbi:hypothetical protein RU94_GL001193 [Enterococcus asini]|nr:hypothetical protein RU94_GL001193 [Enterococcus asini]